MTAVSDTGAHIWLQNLDIRAESARLVHAIIAVFARGVPLLTLRKARFGQSVGSAR